MNNNIEKTEVIFVFILFCFLSCVRAEVFEFEAHRSIQYTKHFEVAGNLIEQREIGPQSAQLDQRGIVFDLKSSPPPASISDQSTTQQERLQILENILPQDDVFSFLSRHILLVPLEHFSPLHFLALKKGVGGALLIVPDEENENTTSSWQYYEQRLLDEKFDQCVIYFAKASHKLEATYRQLQSSSASSFDVYAFISDQIEKNNADDTQPQRASLLSKLNPFRDDFQISLSRRYAEPKPVEAGLFQNIQGSVIGLTSSGLSSSSSSILDNKLPIILVHSYYDAFSIAPSLPGGSIDNGSGMAALLELSRAFSSLYAKPENQGQYNVLFLATGAGRLNFLGIKAWLSAIDVRILDRIEFALCLDSLLQRTTASPGFYMHVSRSAKDARLAKLYDTFRYTAKQMKISPFDIVKQKINISHSEVYWAHEQFARKRVPGATFSALPQSVSPLHRSDLYDRNTQLSHTQLEMLTRNIRFIAESLARFIFHLESDVRVFDKDNQLDTNAIQFWFETVARQARVAPFIAAQQNATLTNALNSAFSAYLSDVSTHEFLSSDDLTTSTASEESITFYTPTKVMMKAYNVKPFTFEIVITISVFTYLFALYVMLIGPQNALSNLKSLFEKEKSSTIN